MPVAAQAGMEGAGNTIRMITGLGAYLCFDVMAFNNFLCIWMLTPLPYPSITVTRVNRHRSSLESPLARSRRSPSCPRCHVRLRWA